MSRARSRSVALPFGVHDRRRWTPKGISYGHRRSALAPLAAITAALALGYSPAAVRAHSATVSTSTGAAKRPLAVRILTDKNTVGRYLPRRIHVRLGQTIRFVNRSIDAHTVTADDGSFDSGYIAIGKHWTFVATRVGRFVYHCTYHPVMGGVIVVSL